MKRELFAAAAIPIMVVTIGWLPVWAFLAILWVAAVLACDEYLKLARAADIVVGRWLVLVLIGALLIASWLHGAVGLAVTAVAALVILPRLPKCAVWLTSLILLTAVLHSLASRRASVLKRARWRSMAFLKRTK